jgi:ABC-type multidrug transport system ATPase subunit
MDMKVKGLSSGMAMKLKLAASLSRDAEVIMLDEPLNGIDIIGRDQIIYVIKQAAMTKNPAILVSSHLFDELEPIVSKVVMLASGRLIVNGDIMRIRETTGKSISDLYREVYSGNFSSVSVLWNDGSMGDMSYLQGLISQMNPYTNPQNPMYGGQPMYYNPMFNQQPINQPVNYTSPYAPPPPYTPPPMPNMTAPTGTTETTETNNLAETQATVSLEKNESEDSDNA